MQPVLCHTVRSVVPMNGRVIEANFDYDGGRKVTVYLPAAPPTAIVFASDGQLIGSWGDVTEQAAAAPIMLVATHRAEDETQRLHEYSPHFDATRFGSHERFFDEVRQWVESRFAVALPRERTAVLGVSAGGELALALGLRHADVYGAILCASPGAGFRPPATLPSGLPRVYLVAGTREPFFLDNATRWEAALRNAGADVVLHERVADHDATMWRAEFLPMLSWAFVGAT